MRKAALELVTGDELARQLKKLRDHAASVVEAAGDYIFKK